MIPEDLRLIKIRQTIMYSQQKAISQDFKSRIIYKGKEHCIPSVFVLHKLELRSFEELVPAPDLASLSSRLARITKDLDDHDMLSYLAEKDLDILGNCISTFHSFKDKIIPQIKSCPFYLGADKTYMQEIAENNELLLENVKEYFIEWNLYSKSKKEKTFIKIYREEDLVIIGSTKQKELKGIKLYSTQQCRCVEIGQWFNSSPLKILQLNYPIQSPLHLSYREFNKRRLVYGEIRQIKDNEITVCMESIGPNRNSAP